MTASSPRSPESLAPKLAVYLCAGPEDTPLPLHDAVAAALAGGVTCVQLRAKHAGGYDMFRMAERLKFLCEEAGALFIVNDRLDVALATGADGVHLGTSDLPVDVARRMTPPDFIIGFSPLTLDDARAAVPLGADYVGLGPVFATPSKADAQPPLGLAGFREQLALCRLPAVGIGGISLPRAASVIEAGADGVAVISAILSADDPETAAADLATKVDAALANRR